MTDGSKQPVTLSYNKATGATLTFRGQTISVSAAQLSGFAPQAGFKFLFGARCGGGTENHLIDDVVITTVIQSTNANLANLTLSAGALSPAFASNITTYTATVPNATTNLTLTPTVAQSNATIKVNGTTVVSGSASSNFALNVGTNLITTIVTAENGGTMTYNVTVVRETGLTGLVLSAGTLSPAFAIDTSNYTASVPNATTNLTVTPTAVRTNATITVNGTPVVSGNASGSLALSVGANPITVIVTGPNGAPAKTYTVVVTRTTIPTVTTPAAASITANSATLGGNVASDGGATVLALGVVMAPTAVNSNPQLGGPGIVNVTGTGSTGPFTVNASGLAPGTAYSFTAYATNSQGIGYSAVGTFTTPYDANLAGLTLSAGALAPGFDSATTNYTVSAGITTISTTVTPTASAANATITVNGIPVASGTASGSIALNAGANTITVVVTAGDGLTTKTYFIGLTLVTRHYVWTGSPSPAAPFTNWNTAAHDIQSAVDVAAAGELVLATNGTYATGGRAITAVLANRVAITNAITLLSVNGPSVTAIQGVGTIGDSAVRCVYLASSATLSGFTLTNGATRNTGANETDGGGVWCADTAPVVTNCVITGNKSYVYGGGTRSGTIRNCTISGNAATQTLANGGSYGGGTYSGSVINSVISGNTATVGGGAYNGNLYNCLITGNRALDPTHNAYCRGGGVFDAGVNNCTIINNVSDGSAGGVAYNIIHNSIIYNNNAYLSGPNYDFGSLPTFAYSCIAPLPSGIGNIASSPAFDASGFRLSFGSPCRDTGNNAYTSSIALTDPDGNPRIAYGTVDMGAYEYVYPVIRVLGTNGAVLPNGYATPNSADGTDFGSTPVTGGQVTRTFAITNVSLGALSISSVQVGGAQGADFAVLSFPATISAGAQSNLVVRFDPSAAGIRSATITVNNNAPTNATYNFAVQGSGRIPVTRYVAANSATPVAPYTTWQTAAQTIQDAVDQALDGDLVLVTNGVYATGGRSIGSALTNRVAINKALTVQSVNGPAVTIIQGAGPLGAAAVRCVYVGTNAVLSGFKLTNGATLNSGSGPLEINGGGVWSEGSGVVSNCTISGCSAANAAGGATGGTLYNCLVTGNSGSYGGGTSGSTLYNSTVTGNSASTYGGGCLGGSVYNSIVYFNTAPTGPNFMNDIFVTATSFTNSCTTPDPAGAGNITSDPGFVAANDFHLALGSPCIDTGNNSFATGVIDLDGNPRIINATVDRGAYEAPLFAPVITLPPASQTVPAGSNASFTVTAVGTGTLGYRWFFNGNEVAGANSAKLNLLNVARTNSGLYWVVITNNAGSTNSSYALLDVLISQKIQAFARGADGRWSLQFSDADGGLLTTNDLPGFEVQVSTNLANWTTFSNSLTLSNGVIYFTEPSATNLPSRFFRERSK